jgi:DGQHR domain-containing protein
MNSFGITIPAIRGQQGDRVFYATNLPNSVLNHLFSGEEPAADRTQRPFDPRHAKEIKEYILANPDEYILGAITYAMDEDGQFTQIGEDPSGTGFALGELFVPMTATFRSLDGQHRRAAVRDAAAESDDIARGSTAILIYVEQDNLKRRQMFSDMNSTPRKVPKSLNVAFDTRDPFSRAAMVLSDEHPLLAGRVEKEGPKVKAESDKFFSLSSVQDALKRLFVGQNGRVKDASKFAEEDIMARGTQFFNALMTARPEYSAAMKNRDSLLKLRNETILFSSTTLRAIAGAAFKAMKTHGVPTLEQIDAPLTAGLASIDFTVSSPQFIEKGFIAKGKSTPSARNQEVVAATDIIAAAIK